ncbi:MAG: rRNA maturation RNase YbeY [Verrucomicrobiota bacterium]
MPEVVVFDHTQEKGIDTPWLEVMSKKALPLCLALPGTEEAVLSGLSEIEVSLVNDEEIARIHDEFMNDPEPTDVITFHHGEILISADTANREGPAHGNSGKTEMLLYLIHGLLHLNGHTDLSEPERERMHECHDRILNELVLGDSAI